MSRIGKQPIELPKGVSVDIKGSDVTVKGSKGTLSQSFDPEMGIGLDSGVVSVTRPSDEARHKAMHGLTRSLINNMVVGVSEGFTKRLEVVGVGYRAELKGKDLVLSLGYSHPVIVNPPTTDTSFEVEDRGRIIIIKGIDKAVVGEVAANIRKKRKPEPYKGKGIRYEGEQVRRKAGKGGKV